MYIYSTVAASQEVVDKLESRLGVAKEELTAASLKLSILVKTFRQSQLYLASSRAAASNVPGQQLFIAQCLDSWWTTFFSI